MAITGVSKPIIADYSAEGNEVTYTNIEVAGKATEYTLSVESAEDNNLYGDNGVAESAAGAFSTGSLEVGTTDMTPNISKSLLGIKEVTRQIGEAQVKELVYDDEKKTVVKGFGIIEEHQIDDVRKFLPIVLPKVKFTIPERAATTRGESIEWQTPTITATVLRSDQVDENYIHPWQISPADFFKTEAEAEEYCKVVLGAEPSGVIKQE